MGRHFGLAHHPTTTTYRETVCVKFLKGAALSLAPDLHSSALSSSYEFGAKRSNGSIFLTASRTAGFGAFVDFLPMSCDHAAVLGWTTGYVALAASSCPFSIS